MCNKLLCSLVHVAMQACLLTGIGGADKDSLFGVAIIIPTNNILIMMLSF